MKILHILYKILGNILIKCFIIIGIFIIPLFTLILKLYYPMRTYGISLVFFIFLLAIERIWETFYSSQERRRHKLYGDWTLALVSLAYIILILGVICEFFLIQRKINFILTSLGLAIFISSFALRMWGIRTLREQWSVHAVGVKKVQKVFLIKSGPYKYIRHPIYLGVILEVLSIPLIWNTYFSFIFACIVNVPLQLIRTFFEESASNRRFGDGFIQYKKEVPAFIPIKISKTN